MLSTKKPDLEPLPGYRLLSPLGQGGFGEVWKCEAPGGLFKAIKFVRGNAGSLLEGSCPSADELRAIQRIKDIRHPFLLSMERVERCGDELVIVMELADKSLNDLLGEHPAGLPRDEVLGYIREAAEVLDLMNFEYGLQHLDIKPRNLFLVRGHVKVADFGLVQDLGDTATRIDGIKSEALHLSVITPLYAAPELFQGKLSERCDQYSLAIVYQELLTGIRPVEGKNVRQLMLQHTVGEPNLDPLPEHDRAVIGRALAKDPEQRHRSCNEMVRALIQAGTGARQTQGSARTARGRVTNGGRGQTGRDTRTNQSMSSTQNLGPPEGRALPDYNFLGCLSRDPRGETWEAQTAEGQSKTVHLLYGIGGAGGRHNPETVMHLQTLRHSAILPMMLVPSGPGCMLLVTDRIETSLRQRYQECQARGEPGVPRAELLDRLEQTAEALDQLYQLHGLHHLELNPARILLGGDKVLLDQIGVAQLLWDPSGVPCGEAQMRYTAPERVQGLITRSCDQYSLAVIYQELLTGKHPFRGASQNRVLGPRDRLKPVRTLDLQPLPATERPVVARALDASPERRFGSCMDFIRALRAAGAASGHAEAPAVNDPARTARQTQITRLVEEAKQWLRLQQGEAAGDEEPEDGQQLMRRRFVAVLPPGAALRKFEAFRQQWDAKLVEEGETFAVFQIAEKTRSWLPWRGKPAALRVEVRWPKPTLMTRNMPEVVVRVLPVTVLCKASAALLPQLGPLLLESLQASLMGSPERRNGERILWPHAVAVSCTAPGRPRGQLLECQGKDVSLTGMGLYMPAALPSSQVQLRLTTPGTGETLTLPGSIVRIQRWDDQLFEVGVVFE